MCRATESALNDMDKKYERRIAEQAAEQLGRHWVLRDREAPDFLVADGPTKFGLELCEIFAGPVARKGSIRKAAEVRADRRISGLRDDYEQQSGGIPLSVKLVGCLCDDHPATVVPALLAMDLSRRAHDDNERLSLYACGALLAVYVRPSIAGRANWLSISDRVGWVDRAGLAQVQDAVDKKAHRLRAFRQGSGLSDQRLLVHCDATMNSGKLHIDADPRIDTAGFNVVYFFRYPDVVQDFTASR